MKALIVQEFIEQARLWATTDEGQIHPTVLIPGSCNVYSSPFIEKLIELTIAECISVVDSYNADVIRTHFDMKG
jgi:hypothetical protein